MWYNFFNRIKLFVLSIVFSFFFLSYDFFTDVITVKKRNFEKCQNQFSIIKGFSNIYLTWIQNKIKILCLISSTDLEKENNSFLCKRCSYVTCFAYQIARWRVSKIGNVLVLDRRSAHEAYDHTFKIHTSKGKKKWLLIKLIKNLTYQYLCQSLKK